MACSFISLWESCRILERCKNVVRKNPRKANINLQIDLKNILFSSPEPKAHR